MTNEPADTRALVAHLLPDRQEEVTLRAGRRTAGLYFVLCVSAFVLGASGIARGLIWQGVVLMFFGALGALIFFLMVRSGGWSMRLTPEGFSCECMRAAPEVVRWTWVTGFYVSNIGAPFALFPCKNVAYHWIEDELKRGVRGLFSRLPNQLPSTFGHSAHDLCIVMNAWHARYGPGK